MLEGFEAQATLSALWLCGPCGSVVSVVLWPLWLRGLYGSVVSMVLWPLWLIPSGSSCDFRPLFPPYPQIHLVPTVLIIIRAMAEIYCPYLLYLTYKPCYLGYMFGM